MYSMSCFFFYFQAPNSLGGNSGQFRLHLSHLGNGGLSLSLTRLEIGRSGGAIYLPSLVLHHTAWSTRKEMSTVSELGAQSSFRVVVST